ncbi:MAG: citryl-CoA lyase [Pseudomonadota bacterium]
MKIGPDSALATAISGSNAETIVVRGRELARELIGSITFTDHAWLLIVGALPSANQRRVFDATLVAIAEHGLVPSVQVARMTLAAAPEALQGAVAAGLLGCGSVILGSSQAAGQVLSEVVTTGGPDGYDQAVRDLVSRYRAERRAIPGYGHPLHKQRDTRAERLFAVAAEVGLSGPHIAAAEAIERLLPELIGRQLAINVSGAIPAVLLDAGYPLLALKGAPLLARTASLIAHLLEEQARPMGFALSEAASADIRYDGPAPEGFVPDERVA